MGELKKDPYKQWALGLTLPAGLAILLYFFPRSASSSEATNVNIVNIDAIGKAVSKANSTEQSRLQENGTVQHDPQRPTANDLSGSNTKREPSVVVNELAIYTVPAFDQGQDYVPFKQDRVILAWDIRFAKSMEAHFMNDQQMLLDSEVGVKVLNAGRPDSFKLHITDASGNTFVKSPSIKLVPKGTDFDDFYADLRKSHQ